MKKSDQDQPLFPTTPDADGYFTASELDKELGIKTKDFPNGNRTKTTELPGGVIVVIRELTGKDTKTIARYHGSDQEKAMMASLTVAATINGKQETFEFFEAMKMKSLNRLISMLQELNF